MSHLYDTQSLQLIGQDIGKNILEIKTHHDKFWITLAKKTDDKYFKMVAFLLMLTTACLFEVIWYNSFQFIFGSLTPVRFPFGLIKILAYTFIGYVVGFEIGWNYTRYINNLLKIKNGINTVKKLIEEVKKPIKKRSMSDVEDYCNGKFCECENLFTCDKEKREIKKDD